MEAPHEPASSTWLLGLASAVVLSLGVAAYVWSRSSANARDAGVGAAKKASAKTVTTSAVNGVAAGHEEEYNGPIARILYGTQTGTAERFSKQLASDLRKQFGGLRVDLVDMENYRAGVQLAREKLVVLCVATYGDGEPTDNAAEFFAWLAQEVEGVEAGGKPAPLQDVSYAVFGLGNKQYEHFNAMGKKAHAGLGALGAAPVIRRGDGDDDGCIDDDFDKWAGELFEALARRPDLVGDAPATNGTNGLSHVDEGVAYDVEVLPPGTPEDAPFAKDGTGKSHSSPYWATITTARELHTPASGRSCVHVEIDITGAAAGYEAGDHVGIHASNGEAVVEEAAGLLGLNLNQLVRLSAPPKSAQGAGLAAPPAGVLSVRTLLSWHADLLSSPHKEALHALAAHAPDPEQAARLKRMASMEGKQEYADYIARPHRSLLEVMRDFPSARPPLGVFLARVAPRLQPRFYSISSSPKPYPASVHVTCAVVRETLPSGRVHEGVASTWLQRQLGARASNKVPVFLRSSHFKLPPNPATPVVMVGPGTGLAPFRGFLQDRSALQAAGSTLGPGVLFFGCRARGHDYIYQEELEGYLTSGALSELHVAFSREGASKDYVQHHLERHAARVWQLLGEQGGYLYVCGDAKHMAKDVHRALVSLVAAAKGCTGTQAEAWVKQFQDAGRYQRDVW